MKKTLTYASKSRPAEILMIEDNSGDIDLALERFSRHKLGNTIHIVRDGAEAIDFIKQQGDFAQSPTPDIIFLDLNLPKISGQELLSLIRQQGTLRDVHVIVMVSSKTEEDIHRSHCLDADSYIQKPINPESFLKIALSIAHFQLLVTSTLDYKKEET